MPKVCGGFCEPGDYSCIGALSRYLQIIDEHVQQHHGSSDHKLVEGAEIIYLDERAGEGTPGDGSLGGARRCCHTSSQHQVSRTSVHVDCKAQQDEREAVQLGLLKETLMPNCLIEGLHILQHCGSRVTLSMGALGSHCSSPHNVHS